MPSIWARERSASLVPTMREAISRIGNSATHSSVTGQLRNSIVTPTTTAAMTLETVPCRVEVKARWAPMTSLLSLLTSAPVWVRVKKASDWRCTWANTCVRRS